MCLCLWVCLYDSSPTPKARSFGGIITLLHFPMSPTLSIWSKISLCSPADTGPRTDFMTPLIIVPNVKFKFNTKEGGPGINYKGHPILTMQCRIWLHFLYSVIDLIGSLGTNEPNTKNRDEPGHFDDIILSIWGASCSQWWEDCGLVWRERILTLIFSVSCQRLINLFLWYWRCPSWSCFISNGLYLDHCLILNSCFWEIGLEKGLCCLQWNIMSISSPVQYYWICQVRYF